MSAREPEALARQALTRLAPHRADDRDTWLRVGMALHSVSLDLLSDWDLWSRSSDKYDARECSKQWRSFKSDKANAVGLGTLVQMAREDTGDANFGKPEKAKPTAQTFPTFEAAASSAARNACGTIARSWEYQHSDGTPAFWIVRIDLPTLDSRGKRKKTFRPIRKVAGHFELGDPPGKLPLYRSPKIASAQEICVFEGENAAEVAAELGLAATTSAHGAGAPEKSDWTAVAGRELVVFPDNDADGIKYLERVAKIAAALVPPATVKAVYLPDLPESGDIVDYMQAQLAAGRSPTEVRATLRALADAAPPFGGFGGSLGGPSGANPEPVPLPDDKPPVAPFDFAFAPQCLANWIRDISERMQCAPDFVFTAAVVALGSLLGRKVAIRPKRLDIWTVVANLWGAAIARPTSLKSPAIQEALKPLQAIDRVARTRFERDQAEHDVQAVLSVARRDANKKLLTRSIENGEDGQSLAERIATDVPEPPSRRRYLVNDSTVEKLGEILNENPNGVLVFRDELVGLLRSLDKEGQEGARAFYLQAWNGDDSYTYDRIERGTIEIEAAIISLFGGIQPGPFAQYLAAAAEGGKGDDGLVQRFQLLVYPDAKRTWKNYDRRPDQALRDTAFAAFRHIDELTPDSVRAERDPEDPDGIPFLHFDETAQLRFDEWREALELRLLDGEEDESFASHLGKYRSLVPSLALIYHLADGETGPVGASALERAIATSVYLESHARRVYAAVTEPEFNAARALAAKIKGGAVQDRFVARDVYQKGWSRLTTAASVRAAADVLVELDWLFVERDEQTGGAPRTTYRVNPRVLEGRGQGTSKTGNRPQPPPCGPARPASCVGNVATTDTFEDFGGGRAEGVHDA